jgi:transcriptional regulator with XRE-family HTH domain
MTTRLTPDEREAELGQHLRDLRLRQNIDQRQLAERADVALNAVKNLEGGKGSTVTSLVKVLRALGREEWLGTLAPQVSISPLQMLKNKKPLRQRASPRRGRMDARSGV